VIKGAQHHIIEIHHTDDPYFERALLFVRTAYADRPAATLEEQGRRFLANTGSYSALQQNRALCWFKRCALVLSGGVGGALMVLFPSAIIAMATARIVWDFEPGTAIVPESFDGRIFKFIR
jgi:hypothetical protein